MVARPWGEEIVNDLKNRLAIVEWRDLPRPPPATASWQIPGIGLAPSGEIRACTWATSSPSSLPSSAVSATVQNVLERIVRAAALPGLMTGLA
jgi:hypothetical protein